MGRHSYIFTAAATAIYLGVLALGINHVWSFVDHSEDRSMRELTDKVFEAAAPGETVLANWETYTGLLFAQVVDGERSDIVLTYVTQDDWRRFVPLTEPDLPTALYSATLPVNDPGDLKPLSDRFFLSFKGRTFQDRSHGEPYPLTVQLFQVLRPTG